MSNRIASLIASLRDYYRAKPDKAIGPDSPATATLQSDGGLRCRIESDGEAVFTDMPKGIGGSASAPSPGWYLRAGVASCAATAIAMRAAELDIELSELSVRVESESDNRGLLGMAPSRPEPIQAAIHVRIRAPNTPPEELRALVEWADARSPVGESLRRSVPVRTVLEIDGTDEPT